jgi:hypothetical protein
MKHRARLLVTTLLIAGVVACSAWYAGATSVRHRDIGRLISLGEQIIVGEVLDVHDGIDANNVPYTEITINIRETAKGSARGTYTFRQFGLIEPRDMGNGLVNLNVTPDGWPTYSQGEDVVLFLYKAARLTGLRTTVGLEQGKFIIEDGYVTNAIGNAGLFSGVSVDKRQLNEKEIAMLQMRKGPVKEEFFLSFLRKALDQKWFPEEVE